MKITDLKVKRFDVKLSVPDLAVGRETLVVEVHTDEGVSGTGFLFVNISRWGTLGDMSAMLLRRHYRDLHGRPLFKSPVFEEQRSAEGVFLKAPLLPGLGVALDDGEAQRLLIPE